MDWQDEGTLLAVRRHGESAAIIEVFTAEHGRHAGIVHGGASRRMAPILQQGALLSVAWHARLEDHLGTFRVEPVKARAAAILGDRTALAALSAICGLAARVLPEREAHPPFYARTTALLDRMSGGEPWHADYVRWELALLSDQGFGLDLSRCAVTGATEGLAYVSPRTGRAVTEDGAGDYADRLLRLPAFLLTPAEDPVAAGALTDGLRLTGYFLHHHLATAIGQERLTDGRDAAAALIVRAAGAS
ncbi:MAG: DNA repair protein RecO [Pseudomonadota bacterium]